MNYKPLLYHIRSITNIQLGTGKTDVSSIDQLVQRDAATNFPCIFDSSLKGALREHFKKSKEIYHSITQDDINYIFGKETLVNQESESGYFSFQQAYLSAIPVRSISKPYYIVLCAQIIRDFLELIHYFEVEFTEQIEQDTFSDSRYYSSISVSDQTLLESEIEMSNVTVLSPIISEFIKKYLTSNEDFIIVPDDIFIYLTSDICLPNLARNKLINGVSDNLWYEQFLPRYTSFYVFIMVPLGTLPVVEEKFKDVLRNKIIQIGANATLGQGLCLFKQLN